MKNRAIALLAVLTIAIVAFGTLTATAQYPTPVVAEVTVSADGTAHVDQSQTVGNVTMDIVAAPGTNGSVSTQVYTGNPNPDAQIADNNTSTENETKLTHFVVVTFNIPEDKFVSATITITFTDADVAGMAQPYYLYKLSADGKTFNPIPATVDYNAHTITAVVTSTTDPLFAIGGTVPVASPTPTENAIPLSTYAIIIIAIGVITGVIVVLAVYQRKSAAKKTA